LTFAQRAFGAAAILARAAALKCFLAFFAATGAFPLRIKHFSPVDPYS
jgi:hypothetical protein